MHAFALILLFGGIYGGLDMTPVIMERIDGVERVFDVYSRFLVDRVVVLDTVIDERTATSICGQMLWLEHRNSVDEIALYINSPGGVISSGLAIYDTMTMLKCPVSTCCFGQAASMAAVLLAAGTPGRRFSLPNSRIMLHQPSGGFLGQASDIQIHADEINRLKEILLKILTQHTGKSKAVLEPLLDRDTFLPAKAAKDLGIIDEVLHKR